MIIEDIDKLISTVDGFMIENKADPKIMRAWGQLAVIADFGSYCWNVLDTLYAQGRTPADGSLDAMETLRKIFEKAIKHIPEEAAVKDCKIRSGYRVFDTADGRESSWYFPSYEDAKHFAKQLCEETGKEVDICKYLGSYRRTEPVEFIEATDIHSEVI